MLTITEQSPPPEAAPSPDALAEVSRLSLRLGLTAFGGPAAHIAMLRDEVVSRRGWMSDSHFLDLLAATNLIPGPSSTELVMHSGYVRAGWRGFLAAGALFIMPAALITLGFARLYERFGATPQLTSVLAGVKPVVIAIILHAVWGLGRTISSRPPLLVVSAAALGLSLAGVNELLVLLGLGVLVMLGRVASLYRDAHWSIDISALLAFAPRLPDLAHLGAVASAIPYSPTRLFLEFLKIGATLYGTGYVLFAFLQQDLVENLGWLTEQQLLDAIAVGQFTPGPVSSTATFVGYLVGGWGGAALATIGIFLPSFTFVALTNPIVPRMRANLWASGFLDGVSSAAVGMMIAVTLDLGQAALTGPFAVALAAIAALLLIRFRVNSAWLIVAGGLAGILVSTFGP